MEETKKFKKTELKQKFRDWQKDHPNFMTPEIVSLEVVNGKIIELSKGKRIFEQCYFYGVSVFKENNEEPFTGFETLTEYGEPFDVYEEALSYIEELKEEL